MNHIRAVRGTETTKPGMLHEPPRYLKLGMMLVNDVIGTIAMIQRDMTAIGMDLEVQMYRMWPQEGCRHFEGAVKPPASEQPPVPRKMQAD